MEDPLRYKRQLAFRINAIKERHGKKGKEIQYQSFCIRCWTLRNADFQHGKSLNNFWRRIFGCNFEWWTVNTLLLVDHIFYLLSWDSWAPSELRISELGLQKRVGLAKPLFGTSCDPHVFCMQPMVWVSLSWLSKLTLIFSRLSFKS